MTLEFRADEEILIPYEFDPVLIVAVAPGEEAYSFIKDRSLNDIKDNSENILLARG